MAKNTTTHQVAEEQRDRGDGGEHNRPQREAVAPGDPRGGQQQRKPDAGDEIQESEQQRAVVRDQRRGERPQMTVCRTRRGCRRSCRTPAAGWRCRRSMRPARCTGSTCSSGGSTRSVPRLGMIAQCAAYMRDSTGSRRAGSQHHGARQMVGIVEQRRHIDQRQRRQQEHAQQSERAVGGMRAAAVSQRRQLSSR